MKRMSRNVSIALVFAALFALPQLAAAEDPVWTAVVALDEGGLLPESVRVNAESETACVSELASYRGAPVIEPCQPALEPSAITDPNDENRSSRAKRPMPVQPVGGGGNGAGNSGGGTGGGGGGGGGGGW